ncbi:hypothetical protein [Breznakiella homolactica]|uniref:Uncharacterized protein n=1 Tax=Breznakiella homolactica TaxID=2798577 RepID=A0A7T7XK72_9SPIR|nr:hypothetical protein [Breznakiella homolactica]QQO07693.1 hypothetical protein JFL75_12140 [Breznakiella homolactica]
MKKLSMITLLLVVLGAGLCAQGRVTERTPVITDLRNPVGMVYDTGGFLYIAEWGAGRVCKYDGQGNRTVVTRAIRNPSGLAFDDAGVLYIASYYEGLIYTLEPGEGKTPAVFASGFNVPAGLLWHNGILYAANREAGEIVKVFSDGSTEVLARGLRQPVGIVRFADNSLVVSTLSGGVNRVSADGRVTLISDALGSPAPGMIADGNDAVLVADYGGTTVRRVFLDGRAEIVAEGFITPVGLVRIPETSGSPSAGKVMVADWGQRAVFIVEP